MNSRGQVLGIRLVEPLADLGDGELRFRARNLPQVRYSPFFTGLDTFAASTRPMGMAPARRASFQVMAQPR